ncbi:hypothetical protein quinque_007432 [Culex quinquefasciatus]
MRNFQLLNSQIDASAMLIPQQQINGGEPVVSDMEVSKEYTPLKAPPQLPPPVPQIVITEQPHPKLHRFRYQSEQRGSTAGSILGVRASGDRPTYPTIEIQGYHGPAKIVISCLSTDDPPRLHPYRLIGRPECRHGLCVLRVGPESGMTCSVNNLAVQSVLKKDVAKELEQRQQCYPNPFKVPVGDASTIDLKKVRLCFELYLETAPGQFRVVHPPVLTDTVYDRKYNPDLVISEMSHCRAPASGGKQIMLLTDTVNKEDIRVRFSEDRPDHLGGLWVAYGAVRRVHRHVAVVVETPAYDDPEITSSVMVQIQLERTTDAELSKPLSFELHPSHSRIPKQEVQSPTSNIPATQEPTPGPSYLPPQQDPNILPVLFSLEDLLYLPPVQQIDPRIPNPQQFGQELNNFSVLDVGNGARNAPVTEEQVENLSCEMLEFRIDDMLNF